MTAWPEDARERDALMAEKVMGWVKYTPFNNAPPEWCEPDSKTGGAVGTVRAYADLWKPTTEIGPAWQVVEKMRDELFAFMLTWDPINATWRASFTSADEDYFAVSENVQAAICGAALRAKGVDV